jgi:hypothetical protein
VAGDPYRVPFKVSRGQIAELLQSGLAFNSVFPLQFCLPLDGGWRGQP